MATNAIGSGTANLSVNVPVDERAELGKTAFRLGFKSVGDFNRYLTLKGLEQVDPEAARRVREVRRAYYGTLLLVVFLGAVVFCHEEIRRPMRRVRVRPVEECSREEA